MPSIKEIRSLTGLRGVVALYVVLYHYFPVSTYSNPLKRLLDHGYLSVDLFFVLSGFVMALNYRQLFASGWSLAAYQKFLGRRIARIYPLYLAATIAGFTLVVLGWLNHYPHGTPLGLALILNVLMVQSWGLVESFDSPAWSISTEWAAYLLFPALLVPAMFRRPLWGWISALLCAATLAALCAFPVHDYNIRTPLNISDHSFGLLVLRCISEFLLGILAFRVATADWGRRIAASRSIAPGLCVVALALLATPRSDLAVVLLFPILVVSLASDTHVLGRILASPPAELLGQLSFSLYLTHKLLYEMLNWLYSHMHASGVTHARTYAAAICIAISFAIAYSAYRTIEVPGRRWLRGLLEGRPAEAILRPALVRPGQEA